MNVSGGSDEPQQAEMMKTLTREEQTELAECLLDIGALLLDSGAEISRVEDTLCRIGRSYGAVQVDVFVITSIISLSMEFPKDSSFTETRRIYSSAGTDFYRLEKLNSLSRDCCEQQLPVGELRARVRHIGQGKKPFSRKLAGNVLAAGAFAVFFGGRLTDGLAAAAFAVIICLIQERLASTRISVAGTNLVLSLLAGIGVGVLCCFIPALNMDRILIGDIMLLIPGLALTNSIRNLLGGDTISGAIRLTESLIWAGTLAGGFMIAMLIVSYIR